MPDPTPARAAFRAAVEAHFAYPPSTWRVEKVADRAWYTVRPDGARLDRCTTKRSATEALRAGSSVRICVGCQEEGTTSELVLPIAWDHLFASDGTA